MCVPGTEAVQGIADMISNVTSAANETMALGEEPWKLRIREASFGNTGILPKQGNSMQNMHANQNTPPPVFCLSVLCVITFLVLLLRN